MGLGKGTLNVRVITIKNTLIESGNRDKCRKDIHFESQGICVSVGPAMLWPPIFTYKPLLCIFCMSPHYN